MNKDIDFIKLHLENTVDKLSVLFFSFEFPHWLLFLNDMLKTYSLCTIRILTLFCGDLEVLNSTLTYSFLIIMLVINNVVDLTMQMPSAHNCYVMNLMTDAV